MANASMPEREPPSEPSAQVTYWLNQIELAQKAHRSFYERGDAINKRYLDEKRRAATMTEAHSMNVLWSNVETIKPALYAQTPSAAVTRRYRDKDKIGRWAAITLERALDYTLDAYDIDYEIRNCVQDYLLPGRGQIWESYEPTVENGKLQWEYCKTKHLNYKDFLHGDARTWGEVPWVAQRAFLTVDEVEAKFGKGVAEKLSFDERRDDGEDADTRPNKAAVWEIWCKTDGKVYFVSKNCPELLKEPEPPFLKFEGFFPCPRPLTTTCTTDSIIPTADFYLYQNQADEIDMLSQRINLLTQALRVIGLYDGSLGALTNLLDASRTTNEMIPCDNWAVFGQGGGFKGSVDFFPLDMIIKALKECYEARERAKATMYEVTGISDIIRGAADPNETATAQQIKTQWGGLRIRERQREVQRFVRDVMRLKAEIIAENFQPETIKTMSNVPLLDAASKQQLQQKQAISQQLQQAAMANPELAQQVAQANPQLAQLAAPLTMDELQYLSEPAWEEVVALLKDQKLRSFRIGIETDSTINADEAEEKSARTEFVTAMTQLVTAWGPIVMQEPKAAPLFGEIMLFATRAFKTAEQLETAIEEMVETLSQRTLMPQPPPPPDPKIEAEGRKMEMERQNAEREFAFKQAEAKAKIADADAARQHELAMKQLELQETAKMEIMKSAAAKPQITDVQAFAPIFEDIAKQLAGALQSQAEALQNAIVGSQNSLAESSKALMDAAKAMNDARADLVAVAMAPKAITVERGANGQIIGGTSKPVLN